MYTWCGKPLPGRRRPTPGFEKLLLAIPASLLPSYPGSSISPRVHYPAHSPGVPAVLHGAAALGRDTPGLNDHPIFCSSVTFSTSRRFLSGLVCLPQLGGSARIGENGRRSDSGGSIPTVWSRESIPAQRSHSSLSFMRSFRILGTLRGYPLETPPRVA